MVEVFMLKEKLFWLECVGKSDNGKCPTEKRIFFLFYLFEKVDLKNGKKMEKIQKTIS